MKKRIFTLTLALLLLVSLLPCSVLATADNPLSTHSNEWINSDGEYEFPVNVDSDTWNKLETAVDMRIATQIPDEILQTISTEDLISLIVKYPLLSNIHAYDTLTDGYYQVKTNFNGISELLTRTDCYTKIIKAYDNYKIPTSRIMNYDNILSSDNFVNEFNKIIQDQNYRKLILADCEVYKTIDILEMLILDSIDETSDSIESFAKVYTNKLIEKNNSEYYDNVNAASLLIYLIDNNSILADGFNIIPSSDNDAQSSNYTIYTPSGTAVICIYDSNISYADPSSYADQIIENNATLISVASTTFNCHSFAWLQNLYPSSYQYMHLNLISSFIADPYYSLEYTPTAPGRIATWIRHSGIVSDTSRNNPYNHYIPEPYLISKWGEGPIVAHFQSRCPYYFGDTVYYYY